MAEPYTCSVGRMPASRSQLTHRLALGTGTPRTCFLHHVDDIEGSIRVPNACTCCGKRSIHIGVDTDACINHRLHRGGGICEPSLGTINAEQLRVVAPGALHHPKLKRLRVFICIHRLEFCRQGWKSFVRNQVAAPDPSETGTPPCLGVGGPAASCFRTSTSMRFMRRSSSIFSMGGSALDAFTRAPRFACFAHFSSLLRCRFFARLLRYFFQFFRRGLGAFPSRRPASGGVLDV